MLKRGQQAVHGSQLPGKVSMRCPDCGEVAKTCVPRPLALTLKKVIVLGGPVVKKPGETAPEKKSQPENQAG